MSLFQVRRCVPLLYLGVSLHGPNPEEVGHILCAHDDVLCSSAVLNLVPMSTWPGTEGKRKVPTRSGATVGEFEDALGWAGFQLEFQECLVALSLAVRPSLSPRKAKISFAFVFQGRGR